MIVDKLLLLKIDFVQQFGILLIFLATFIEASPVIGLFIPGAVICFIGGFFAKFGLMNVWMVMIAAVLGAILGDSLGYILGKYSKKEFIHKYARFFFIRKGHIERIGDICCEHTGKSLILGRLNPLTRVFAPFFVGAHKVRFRKFMIFNIIGGIIYGVGFVSLGYLFGRGYEIAAKFDKWIVLATIFVILLFYLVYFIRLIVKKMNNGGLYG